MFFQIWVEIRAAFFSMLGDYSEHPSELRLMMVEGWQYRGENRTLMREFNARSEVGKYVGAEWNKYDEIKSFYVNKENEEAYKKAGGKAQLPESFR